MSETQTADDGARAVPPDPIYQKSYSVHIAVASVALVGAVALAITDEIWLRRPYKAYQADYKAAKLAFLDKVEKERKDFDGALRSLDEFKALQKAVDDQKLATDAARIEKKNVFTQLDARVTALTAALRVQQSQISALTYDASHAAHQAGDHDAASSDAAKPYIAEIAKVHAEKIEFTWKKPTWKVVTKDVGGVSVSADEATYEDVKESSTAGELIPVFVALQGAKGAAQVEMGKAVAPLSAATKARDAWLKENLASIKAFMAHGGDAAQRVAAKVGEVGASRYLDEYTTPVGPDVVAKLKSKLNEMGTGPIFGGDLQPFQIHLKDTNNWVDRCQVCHSGVISDVPVNADQLRDAVRAAGWPERKVAATDFKLYESHPRAAELFAKHDPDKMGCSTCHNGNGIAITATDIAHGENHDWLWPLFPKENLEAGCVQCHQGDVALAGGPRITKARETFMDKGCWGCHPYEGYNVPATEINKVEGRIKDLRAAQDAKLLRKTSIGVLAKQVPDENPNAGATLDAANAEANALQEEVALLDGQILVEQKHLASLVNEREKVGPNLKELRIAIRPEILTPWINDPTSVRPDTKMPVFRWWAGKDANGLDEDAKDVAAFLWQAALDPKDFPELRSLAAPQGGSPGTGKGLFEKTGCLGCHSVEREGQRVGGTFAANLSLVGEKKTYEWIYRWIKDPRHRLVPWSTVKGRDLSKAEWEKEDPDTLVWTMPTRMPNLRLSDDEARDIATYLSTLKGDRKWPQPTWLDDKVRAEKGRAVVLTAGCAGCHEIAGLESERGIGTDLTKEGSKPLDRLDFGHLTTHAKRGHEPIPDFQTADGVKIFAPKEGESHGGHGWYRPRGYFMHKLAQPELFDQGRYFPDRFLRARMPKFTLTAQEVHDLTTFLLGSVDTRIPESSRYRPDDRGQAVRDGWWVIKKYNCEGCHPVEPGQVPVFTQLPWWSSDDLRDKRDSLFPPTLVGAGARLRPEWLAHFLKDPSLGGGTKEPRSVRKHLDVRMPTFEMTEDEIAKLVRFFGAMSNQPPVYQPAPVPALSDKERAAALAIWTDANCLQCHVVGDTPITSETKAPNFAFGKQRLRPEWMKRWIPNPPLIQPTTKMSPFFHREDEKDPKSRWIYNNAALPALQGVTTDHVDLMIRYIQTLAPAAK